MSNQPILQQLAQATSEGAHLGIAVGSFGLIHAGTVRFLQEARCRCDRLFAAVLALPRDQGEDGGLLRPDERLRILKLLCNIEDAGEISPPGAGDLEAWRQAAPNARWMVFAAEDNDPARAAATCLQAVGLDPVGIQETEHCTTAAVLQRMGAGDKPATTAT